MARKHAAHMRHAKRMDGKSHHMHGRGHDDSGGGIAPSQFRGPKPKVEKGSGGVKHKSMSLRNVKASRDKRLEGKSL